MICEQISSFLAFYFIFHRWSPSLKTILIVVILLQMVDEK